jgi:hypothetical protein
VACCTFEPRTEKQFMRHTAKFAADAAEGRK